MSERFSAIIDSSIQKLREELEKRDDVPVDFPHTADKTPRVQFTEHEGCWVHQTWQTEPDNGSLYPSEDSYAPYLEIV